MNTHIYLYFSLSSDDESLLLRLFHFSWQMQFKYCKLRVVLEILFRKMVMESLLKGHFEYVPILTCMMSFWK